MDFAQASNDVYTSVRDRPKNIGKFLLDVDLSDDTHSIYANPHTGESHLSIRGTADFQNVNTDLRLMMGGLSTTERFAQANSKLKQMRHKYGDINSTSGHSLGGSLSIMLAENEGVQSHAFNPGGMPQDTVRNFFCEKSNDELCVNRKTHINLYTVQGDPISNAYHLTQGAGVASHQRIQPKNGAGVMGLSAHSMSNFL